MTKIIFSALTQEQKLETADLMQKLQAIEGALVDVNDERVTGSAVYNKKQYALEEEKKVVTTQLRAIRTVTVEETL